MRVEDFTDKKPGRLLEEARGYWAFVPNPLPPKLTLTWELVGALSEADRALSELAGVARTLPNPHLLIGPFVRREAVLSSRIEGTQASLSDLFFFEASEETLARTSDVREVANYVRALEFGLSKLAELPVSLRLIQEMHGVLLAATATASTPGEFRRSQNCIGPPGCTLEQATYVPPPPEHLMEVLAGLERFLHAEHGLPPLVRYSLLHYQFEAIHPFLDGNGRLGRLLVSLLLCADGVLPQPLLYVSAFFERNRAEYYRLLLAVTQRGEWQEWIRFFLRGVVEQARDAIWRSDQLLALQARYRNEAREAKVSALVLQILDDLFASPVTSIPRVANVYHRSFSGAQLAVEKLMELGVLAESTGRRRDRLFVATEIVRVLEQPKPGVE